MQKLLFFVSLILVAVSFGFNFWNQKTLTTMQNRSPETVIVREITAKDNRDSSYLATESLMRRTSVLVLGADNVTYPGIVFTADGSVVVVVQEVLPATVQVYHEGSLVTADLEYQDRYTGMALIKLRNVADLPTNTVIYPADMGSLREVTLVAPVASHFSTVSRVVSGSLGVYRRDVSLSPTLRSNIAEGVWELYTLAAAAPLSSVVFTREGALVGLYPGGTAAGKMVDAQSIRAWWDANKDMKATVLAAGESKSKAELVEPVGFSYQYGIGEFDSALYAQVTEVDSKLLRLVHVGDNIVKVNGVELSFTDSAKGLSALLHSSPKASTLTLVRSGKTLDVVLPQ